jgi:hypothetical protein
MYLSRQNFGSPLAGLVLTYAVLQVSCSNASTNPASPEAAACRSASLSATGSEFDAQASEFVVNVITPGSDCRWIAQAGVAWIAGSSGSQLFDPRRSGDGYFSFGVTPNYSLTPRSGQVQVRFTDGTTLVYNVSQQAAHCVYAVSPASRLVGASGGFGTIEVMTTPPTCAWTAYTELGFGDPQWHFHVEGQGLGRGTATYGIAPSLREVPPVAFRILVNGSDPTDPPAVFSLKLDPRGP